MPLTYFKKFFPNVIRRTSTLRIGFPKPSGGMKKGNQYQRGNFLRGPLSFQRGRVLLKIRLLLSLNEPEIHRILVLYLSEVKDGFLFLGRETSEVPQLKTSWAGRKSGRYARVTRLNNTPDPGGSCMARERLAKRIVDSETSRWLQR